MYVQSVRQTCTGHMPLSTHTTETSYLNPWSRVCPEKLSGPQVIKKFHAFYGTRRFISTRKRLHLSVSWARLNQPNNLKSSLKTRHVLA